MYLTWDKQQQENAYILESLTILSILEALVQSDNH